VRETDRVAGPDVARTYRCTSGAKTRRRSMNSAASGESMACVTTASRCTRWSVEDRVRPHTDTSTPSITDRRASPSATVPDSPNVVQRYFVSAFFIDHPPPPRSNRPSGIARAVHEEHEPNLAKRSARATRSRALRLDSRVPRLPQADPSRPTARTPSPRYGVAPGPTERPHARRRGTRARAARRSGSLQTRS
jgi:hypothetical protein